MEGMRKPATSAPRERVLSDAEIKKLWLSLPTALPRSVACQQIIKLCLLTGQRVGEVAGMTRAELDLQARTWTIPAARSKNKHAHVVPLSGGAIAVIKEARGASFCSRTTVTALFPLMRSRVPCDSRKRRSDRVAMVDA